MFTINFSFLYKWSKSLIEINLCSSNITEQGLEVLIDGLVRNSNECPLRGINLSGTCVTTDLVQ